MQSLQTEFDCRVVLKVQFTHFIFIGALFRLHNYLI